MQHDPQALAALHKTCFSESPPPWSAESFAALLQSPHTRCITHDESGFLIGQIIATPEGNDGEAEILTLAVDPRYRRNKIGARLLARFLNEAHKAGARRVFLEVAAHNIAAQALYQTAGFIHAGVRKRYYKNADGTTCDAALMHITDVQTHLDSFHQLTL